MIKQQGDRLRSHVIQVKIHGRQRRLTASCPDTVVIARLAAQTHDRQTVVLTGIHHLF
ncbi:hypothetical protein [Ralstonia sp. SET104]|uniref:hypothetical protein n=1 Tax=Ralstonia sp. SET104 TaxID=2448774 RepID=UPI0021A9E020|nr:hypothetical protein [Ralstonia sp. SET104]